MKASVTLDACRGDLRPRRLKVERKDGTVTEALSTDVLRELLKQREIEADVRADWFAINRRCSSPGCLRAVARLTAWRALKHGYPPVCIKCWRAKPKVDKAKLGQRSGTWICDYVKRAKARGCSAEAIVDELDKLGVTARPSGRPLTVAAVTSLMTMPGFG